MPATLPAAAEKSTAVGSGRAVGSRPSRKVVFCACFCPDPLHAARKFAVRNSRLDPARARFSNFAQPSLTQSYLMAKSSVILDWCIVRLGSDHNWWVDEVSDPVRWDVDGLSIIDPRQMAHLIELVEPLRDYGFDQDIMESAFICFRIEKEAAEKGAPASG
jgi:hypothetical protein